MTTSIYATSPIKRPRRTKAQMETFYDALLGIVAEQAPMTVRQVFYQAEVRGLVEKAETGYSKVQRAVLHLREQDVMPFSWIEDGTRLVRKPETHDSIEDALWAAGESYRRAIWGRLNQRIEIWCEKDALSGVLFPVTSEYDVQLMVSRGYSSATYVHAAAMAIKSRWANGIQTFVYHLGDYDPSGQDAARDIQAKLSRYAPSGSFYFEQVAVLPWQISHYGLPTRPTKKTDSRAKSFSPESVELDAIPPDELRSMVRLIIEDHLPDGHMDGIREAEVSERRIFARLYNDWTR